jgi:hypothetical protein
MYSFFDLHKCAAALFFIFSVSPAGNVPCICSFRKIFMGTVQYWHCWLPGEAPRRGCQATLPGVIPVDVHTAKKY